MPWDKPLLAGCWEYSIYLPRWLTSEWCYSDPVDPRATALCQAGQNAVNRNNWEFCFEKTLLIWIKIPMPCSFSIDITQICYIPFLCLWPKYTRFFRGTNIHLTATAIHFIWKIFVGHHISHSTKVSEVLLCVVRDCFSCRNRKSTNRENQKKYLKCENRLFKASVSVIYSLWNTNRCNFWKSGTTASDEDLEFMHTCNMYTIEDNNKR